MLRDLLASIDRWHGEAKRVAVATVIEVWGSAPRQPGARMAVSSAGEIAGSVSGGCVEGAVVHEALAAIEAGSPRLVRYGVTHEQAWAVGLSCGGTIEIFIEPLGSRAPEPAWAELRRAIDAEQLVALATVIDGPGAGRRIVVRPDGTTTGTLGQPLLDARAVQEARERFRCHDGRRVLDLFVEAHAPRSKLVVVGAVHVAIPLVRFARALGFRSYVVDPREAFATAERFAEADEVIVDWPEPAFARIGIHETSYVAVLTHDPKIDLPALSRALSSNARYIGALGSRRTHEKRVAELREMGHADAEIARIHSPIGLDLGGRQPEEIAVAIIAEIVAARHGSDKGR